MVRLGSFLSEGLPSHRGDIVTGEGFLTAKALERTDRWAGDWRSFRVAGGSSTVGPVPISSSGRGRSSKREMMLIQRDDLRCAETAALGTRAWQKIDREESGERKQGGEGWQLLPGMRYSYSTYLAWEKFRSCMGRNESSQRGVLDVLVKDTPSHCGRANPGANQSRPKGSSPRLGRNDPCKTWNRRSYPTSVIWFSVESAAEELVRSGPALGTHSDISVASQRAVAGSAPVSRSSPITMRAFWRGENCTGQRCSRACEGSDGFTSGPLGRTGGRHREETRQVWCCR